MVSSIVLRVAILRESDLLGFWEPKNFISQPHPSTVAGTLILGSNVGKSIIETSFDKATFLVN